MNKRQRKKIMLNGLNKEERYRRTHCPVCKEKIGIPQRRQRVNNAKEVKEN